MKWAMVALAILSGCSGPANFDYESPVKRQLRDPTSAQFSDVTVNIESACGFVNSKNGFGGYSGTVPFIVIGSSPESAEVVFVEEPGDRVIVESRCLNPTKAKIDKWITDKVVADLGAISK
ncbi:hypothetical protein [Sphingopyxis sp. 550A]